jgi:protein involved in polysaccharide export with SLBB domain
METNSALAPYSTSKRRKNFAVLQIHLLVGALGGFFVFIATTNAQSDPRSQGPRPAPSLAPLSTPMILPQEGRSISAPVSAANTSPPPASISAPIGYQLSANDQIAVEVFGEDDLRTATRLDADGVVSLPLLGAVRLGGLTLHQAATRLTELYGRDYLVNPKVNVSLVGYAKRRFTILGQVNRPGSYDMPEGSPEGIDLLEAVAMAGGYTRIAAPERISVRRHIGNTDQVMRVDAKRLARGGGTGASSYRVEPGDTITVGESIF